ncbi:hypothetical protein Acr_20g0006920 [Actinidia rufa]|uniref:Uncharacterized protein n=1 Tax=Actinidia rufa TaxID=165716 RepID=A0A7J0GDN1_9ERIC|nr:hypothetical protein Acr_20g0006920 [Actinidia rufa]
MGAVKKNSDIQVTFYLLTPLVITTSHCVSPNSSTVNAPSLLINDSSELKLALVGAAVAFNHDCSELQNGETLSLLCSDSLVEIFALVRPVLDSVRTEFWHKGLSSLISNDRLMEAPALVRYMSGKPMLASCLPFAFNCHSTINIGDRHLGLVRYRALEYWHRGPSLALRACLEVGSSGLGMTAFGHSRGQGGGTISLDSLGTEEEEEDSTLFVLNRNRDRVIPAFEPPLTISISSSNNEHSGNLAHTTPSSVGEVEITLFKEISYFGNKLGKADTLRQVTVADSSKDYDISMALTCAILLPTNEESLEVFRDLLAKKRVGNLESKLNKAKLRLATIEQLKVDLVAIEQAWDASYATATQAENKVVAIKARLIKFQAVACGLVYKRVFNRGSADQGTIIVEGKDAVDVVVPLVNEAANLIDKVGRAAVKESVEEVTKEVGEDAAWIPFPSFDAILHEDPPALLGCLLEALKLSFPSRISFVVA